MMNAFDTLSCYDGASSRFPFYHESSFCVSFLQPKKYNK